MLTGASVRLFLFQWDSIKQLLCLGKETLRREREREEYKQSMRKVRFEKKLSFILETRWLLEYQKHVTAHLGLQSHIKYTFHDPCAHMQLKPVPYSCAACRSNSLWKGPHQSLQRTNFRWEPSELPTCLSLKSFSSWKTLKKTTVQRKFGVTWQRGKLLHLTLHATSQRHVSFLDLTRVHLELWSVFCFPTANKHPALIYDCHISFSFPFALTRRDLKQQSTNSAVYLNAHFFFQM